MWGFMGHSENWGFYSACEEKLLEVLILNGMIQSSSFKRYSSQCMVNDW